MRFASDSAKLIPVAMLIISAACSEKRDASVLNVQSSVTDSVPRRGASSTTTDPTVITLLATARLRITLLERDGAALHALSIAAPQDTLLAGPGYLFPGPTFLVGPYPAGQVELRLDVYDNYPPNAFLGVAASQITGTYPDWTIRFEDAGDNDYNDIVIRVEALPENLSVRCDPPTVERATSVNCVPSVPPGSTLEITGWKFTGGPNNQFEIPSTGAPPATWNGIMVVGGVVKVYANVNGVLDSATATVNVTARSWPSPPMDDPARDSTPNHLPADPDTLEDLGHTHQLPHQDSTYPSDPKFIKAVVSGPNYLLFYNNAPHITRIQVWTEVNREALTNSSNAWYQSHPKNRQTNAQGQTICRQQDLRTTVLNFVVSHEAAHVAFGRNWWSSHNLNSIAESVVSKQGSQALVDATHDAIVAATTAENVANKQSVDGSAILPCALIF